jgi:nitrite reductase/ring-hydroxylating ferredoxin subunit
MQLFPGVSQQLDTCCHQENQAMNRFFSLASPESVSGLSLRTIECQDLEDLRLWKNANRRSFFFQGTITPAGQRAWFEGYLGRAQDFMFLVESHGLRAGCMGFRILGGSADAYNIIASPKGRGWGIMAPAMRLMCSFILKEHTPVMGCTVLKGNLALSWYKKCGWRVVADRAGHEELELDMLRFVPYPYEVRGPGYGFSPLGPDFYPRPIRLGELRMGKVNRCRLDDEVEVAVILRREGLVVIGERCPHMGGPLSDGRYRTGEGAIECPWHGYRFDVRTGKLTENPNDAVFACLKGLYVCHKPERRPRYRLELLSCEMVGEQAYVRRRGSA